MIAGSIDADIHHAALDELRWGLEMTHFLLFY